MNCDYRNIKVRTEGSQNYTHTHQFTTRPRKEITWILQILLMNSAPAPFGWHKSALRACHWRILSWGY